MYKKNDTYNNKTGLILEIEFRQTGIGNTPIYKLFNDLYFQRLLFRTNLTARFQVF